MRSLHGDLQTAFLICRGQQASHRCSPTDHNHLPCAESASTSTIITTQKQSVSMRDVFLTSPTVIKTRSWSLIRNALEQLPLHQGLISNLHTSSFFLLLFVYSDTDVHCIMNSEQIVLIATRSPPLLVTR